MPQFKEIKAGDKQISASNLNAMMQEIVRQAHFDVAPPLAFTDGGSGRTLQLEDIDEVVIAQASDYDNTFPDTTDEAEWDRKQWPFCILRNVYLEPNDNTKSLDYPKDAIAQAGRVVKAANLFNDQWPVPGMNQFLFRVNEQWFFYYVPQRKRVKIIGRGGDGTFTVQDCVQTGNKLASKTYDAFLSDSMLLTGGSVDYQPGTIAYVRWDMMQKGFATTPSSFPGNGSWVFCDTIRWARTIIVQYSKNLNSGDTDNSPTLNKWFDGRDPRKNEDPDNPGGGTSGFYVAASDQNSQGDSAFAVLDTQVEAGSSWQPLRYVAIVSDCPTTVA